MGHVQETTVDQYNDYLRKMQKSELDKKMKKDREGDKSKDAATEEDLIASVDKTKEFQQKVRRENK